MNNICQALIYEELSVLKAYNPINPTLNTIGVQCGVIVPIPCVPKVRALKID